METISQHYTRRKARRAATLSDWPVRVVEMTGREFPRRAWRVVAR